MTAASTDKVRKSANNFATTLSSSIAGPTDVTAAFTSVTNLPTDTATDFVIDRVDSTGARTPSKREYVKGVIIGSNLTSMVRGLGGSTAQAHSSGAVVEAVQTAEAVNDFVDAFTDQHNQDGTHAAVTATSVASTGPVSGTTGTFSSDVSDNSTTLKTIRAETSSDFVASGAVWSITSGLVGAMTAGVVYIGGKRVPVSLVSSKTFTVSVDTYVSVDNTGTVAYTTVANNANAPSLPANSVWLAYAITSASAISSFSQGMNASISFSGFDSNAIPIYPTTGSRVVGRKIRNTPQSSGVSGSLVLWNGMPSLPFIGTVGRTYRLIMHEPFIDTMIPGTNGGFVAFNFYNDPSTTPTTTVGVGRAAAVSGGNSAELNIEFTARQSGLQYINIQMSTYNVTGTMVAEANASYPATYTVSAV
jgi:hypothetical protein